MKEKIKEKLIDRSNLFCSFLNYRDKFRHKSNLCGNRYFETESIVMYNLIPQNKVMLDIGANWGAYSVIYSSILGEKNVYSFEPVNSAYRKLFRRRKGINCYNEAVSSEEGECIIKIPEIGGSECSYRSTLSQEFTCKEESSYRTEKVNKVTVDKFVQRNLLNIGFLKIDVEGHEIEVIKGAMKTIVSQKPLMLIEIEQQFHDIPIDKVFELLPQYTVYFLSPPPEYGIKNISNFNPSIDQDERKVGSKNYINNFIFIPN